MPNPLICLITPGHLASTPRLLKEADALVDAGYRVHVVAGRHYAPVEPLDEQVINAARWPITRVDYRRGPAVFLRKLRRRLARSLVLSTPFATVNQAARAHHAESLHLGAVASGIHADLYVGHCLAALPAAAHAAAVRGVRCGFDLEDFHDSETAAAAGDPVEVAAARLLQSRLLPKCRHLTAASPLIAQKYAELYRVKAEVVLNAFPRTQAPIAPIDPGPITATRPARFYWFSQTIGPGRGLEDVLAAMGRMQTPAELQLRGFVSPGYADHLQAVARTSGLKLPVKFLAPGPAADMARLAARADLGLSTEEPPPPLNRDLCLSNKIFVYLLAGIPQLLSRTVAQAAFATGLGDAGLTADLADPAQTARKLDAFFADPGRVAAARRQAWTLAQSRYCWDVEKEIFLASIRRALAPAPGA